MLKNMTNSTCWHSYGLISQNERDYESARRSFQFALKFDKENMQILRDLAIVQMQLREYGPACSTCNDLLVNKPLQLHWLLFAAVSFLVRL